MKGFYVWCGSLIRAEGRYHLFASRWPKATRFPDGYRTHSEIVRAVANRPEAPFTFAERVIAPREGDFWDSRMAHNPRIVRVGDKYVLLYIGSEDEGKIGRLPRPPRDLLALLRSLWLLGFRHSGRTAYWRFFWSTLLRQPRQMPHAIELSIFGHHYRRVADRLQ